MSIENFGEVEADAVVPVFKTRWAARKSVLAFYDSTKKQRAI
jgi:hypothetical protein